jgi:hypothetical protein
MLIRLSPIEYVRPMEAGRTGPLLILCVRADDEPIEIVAKFSDGCDQGVTSLAREVIAACLAGDLGLPIPEPFLVDITPEWAAVVTDSTPRARIHARSLVAFGSRHITGQYTAWSRGNRLFDAMLGAAAGIFVFDAITQNADRRVDNPNCLVRGNEIRIFDHEMTFTHGLVIGWRPPWLPGGLKDLEKPEFHIFREQLRRRALNFEPIRAAWTALSDARLAAYGAAVPPQWAAANLAVGDALALIRDARDNIDGCLTEVQRILR